MWKCFIIFIAIVCICPLPSRAQIYRWTDAAGKVHYTDNLGTVPPSRRQYSRQPSLGSATDRPGKAVALPESKPSTSDSDSQNSSAAQIRRLRQRAQALEQQIAAALQQRQRYFAWLKAERPVRMNPAFGRRRRRVDKWGHALATVERQLDAFHTELRQLHAHLQTVDQTQQPAAPKPQPPHEITMRTR